MKESSRLQNVQVLRAVAAIGVVAAHSVFFAKKLGFEPWLTRPLEFLGQSGVDIFFVISGFIMVFIQSRRNYGSVAFFLNRCARILPVYWTLTAFLLISYSALPKVIEIEDLTGQWTVSSFLFLSQLVEGKYPVLYVGWTLEMEMLFYLVFSISLLLRRMDWIIAFTVLLILLGVAVFGKMIFCEFILGMAIAYVYITSSRYGNYSIASIVLASGLLLLLLSPVLNDLIDVRIVYWGIPAAMIVAGAVFLPQIQNSLLVRIGDASYSIYLIQAFTIPLFLKFDFGSFRSGIQADTIIMLLAVSTTVIGYCFYWTFERNVTSIWSRLKRIRQFQGV